MAFFIKIRFLIKEKKFTRSALADRVEYLHYFGGRYKEPGLFSQAGCVIKD